MLSKGDKKKAGAEGHHSKAELLAKVFPERSLDDIHVILEKNGGNIEAAEWELLADKGSTGPCRDKKVLHHCPSSGYWKYVDG